ncbi:hypothetical protein QBC39DRAFT_39542 [Podospora conica]|nr:hypothetical protein QBC39DRAFT_39542 [Schizothecium conicum]
MPSAQAAGGWLLDLASSPKESRLEANKGTAPLASSVFRSRLRKLRTARGWLDQKFRRGIPQAVAETRCIETVARGLKKKRMSKEGTQVHFSGVYAPGCRASGLAGVVEDLSTSYPFGSFFEHASLLSSRSEQGVFGSHLNRAMMTPPTTEPLHQPPVGAVLAPCPPVRSRSLLVSRLNAGLGCKHHPKLTASNIITQGQSPDCQPFSSTTPADSPTFLIPLSRLWPPSLVSTTVTSRSFYVASPSPICALTTRQTPKPPAITEPQRFTSDRFFRPLGLWLQRPCTNGAKEAPYDASLRTHSGSETRLNCSS